MAQHFDSETVEVMADIDATVVEDSLAGLEQKFSIGAKDSLLGMELNEAVEFQVVEEMNNPRAAHDMRLLGRLWADEGIDEEVDDENLVFLSEPMIVKDNIPQWFWTTLNLKLFFVNDRGPLIPSIWGLCKLHLAPIVISNSFQQVSMVVSVEGKDLFIAVVYVLGNHECRGIRLTPSSPCVDFKNFSDSTNLIHLQTRGAAFTWSNRRRGNALTEKRLDRSLCNNEWIDSWSQVACCTLPRISYDHHLILINSDNGQLRVQPQFKFQKMWMHHHDCSRLVEEVWKKDIIGCSMSILSQKLKLLKKEFKVWNVEVFGLVQDNVKLALEAVDFIQNNIAMNGPNDDNLEADRAAQQSLMQALTIEEEFWRQKSRLNWHTSGDRNTSFFHRVTKIKNSTKSLTMLRSGGCLITDQSEIENLVLNYFKDLFATPNYIVHNDMVNIVVPTMIIDTDNSKFSSIPSHDEIKSAVFDMNGDGALRPDGFGGADKIEDFRPIAMANFQFKIISKVLADRLANIAPKIISIQQRGFIKDRQINDCICLTSEAINLLDHKVFGGNLAIKIDIKKAFDTIDWDFLLLTLQKLGFNYKFRNWIRIILHSARLSINVNGKMVGFFKCTRGVRQGDPLSPLLHCSGCA
ncbi:PREDICTED: uncharacterized protein LOC109344660 [Lupinus angustifolius]|uniref:uncharacterized protein LOC109344660 n=1 Tax=Lupinus angustifolius TaxID=3871 RepID=UPI00092E4927|nr:PREDICTED: uncharacterized protein LOC109344660 [Lupinus angustifolius]